MEETKKTEEEKNKIPDEENTDTKETETINKKPGNMETHAHHLHHAPGKKIMHYFYEFLMLFLAVFCGFLAENFREKSIEYSRETEFMKSMAEDLQMDTAQLSRIKIFRLGRLNDIDSIIMFFQSHPSGSVPAYGYTLANKLFGHAGFFQNNGTMEQLKNSGGLRLIRRRNVVDSLEAYDQQVKRIELRDTYETNFSFDHNKILQKLFEGRVLFKIYTDTSYRQDPGSGPALIKLNEQYIDEYLNSLRTFQNFVKLDMYLQETVKDRASRLITLIKKEYQLE